MIRLFLTSFILFCCSATVFAMPGNAGCGSQDCAKCHSLSIKEANELLGFAKVKVKSVKPAPARGLHEVLFEKNGGVGIVFIDYAKKHLIQGMIIDLKTKEPVAAHQNDIPKPKQFTGVDPKLIPVQYAFVMGNPKGTKKIYIFTDPDCPFCRQLHPVLQQLTKQMPDLAINIMLYPLRQLHPQSYDKARVIITEKKQDILDKAFSGRELPRPKGDEGKAAVDAVLGFAQQHGVTSTPMILLSNGKPYNGPRTVDAMKKVISEN